MHTNETLSLFQTLLAIPSPSGREDNTAAKIVEIVSGWGYSPTRDAAGNVLIRLEGAQPQGPLVCYASHMDEIGFTVTNIRPDGRLQAIRRGGLFPWKAGETPVEVMANDGSMVRGVLSMGAGHNFSADKGITWENVTIMTGLTPAELAERGVEPGAPGVMAREMCGPFLFGNEDDPLVGCWTFDDRIGCTILLRLLSHLKENDLKPALPTLIAFTTREEVGGYGAKFLSQREKPDIFIAVDGAPMPPEAGLSLDRPVLWLSDRLGPYDHGLATALMAAGKSAGVEIQKVAYQIAASDASLVAYAGGAGRIACFGHPRENSHGYEVAKLAVFDDILETLKAFVVSWEDAG